MKTLPLALLLARLYTFPQITLFLNLNFCDIIIIINNNPTNVRINTNFINTD